MAFVSKNPVTEEIIETFEAHTEKQVEQKLSHAERASKKWRASSFKSRARLMKKLAVILREKKRILGEIVTREMGKPLVASMSEIEKSALACDYFAEHTEKMLMPEKMEVDVSESYISFEPLGVVLAVMPWNFPFWQVFRFAAPAIMGGNVGVLKHASNVSRCALLIEELFLEAGFPKGIFQTLLIDSGKVATHIADRRIAAVTLTGSTGAGRSVASASGQALKKVVLELGGSDPFIVLADADVKEAAREASRSRLQNAGQSCIAAKRFIVVRSKVAEFSKLLRTEFSSLQVGDGMEEGIDMGPLSSEHILHGVEEQVSRSVKIGAKVLIGGARLKRKGYFYRPTILTNVKKGMPVFDEEVFGPVASIIAVKDEKEAIAVANDTVFGLGASLWTKDIPKAKRLAARIEAGEVAINKMMKSDPRLPFGGIKHSGYGRELSSYGLKEFMNIKTVCIK